jgi:hypothetical protein
MRLHRYAAFVATACLAAGILAATAGPAAAVIPDCLPGPGVRPCVTFSPFMYGGQALTWVDDARINNPLNEVVIAPLHADDASQDFHARFWGTVLQAWHESLVNASLLLHYGHDPLYEFEYSEAAGVQCLGSPAAPAVTGTRLDVQACGQSAETLWLVLGSGAGVRLFGTATSDDSARYLEVMTVSRGTGHVVITTPWYPGQRLNPAQLWDVLRST